MTAGPSAALEILRAGDPDEFRRWDELVSGAAIPDVYYRPGYAKAYERTEQARALALVIGAAGGRFLVPLMLRNWQEPRAGRVLADGFSPYGYSGLLPLASAASPSHEDLVRLLDALHEWCREQRLVCCVLRLHPLLEQHKYFEPERFPNFSLRLGQCAPTTAVDLATWSEGEALAGMRKGRRSDLNVARRSLSVKFFAGDSGPATAQATETFHRIYADNMERLHASNFLRFSLEYFRALSAGLGNRVQVALAVNGKTAVGGAVFLLDRDFAHYHLSATTEEGRRDKAATLLIVAGAARAREQGCRLLHLGGGLAPGDPLFQFKRSFGGKLFQYRTVTIVVDRDRYATLCTDPAAPWPYKQ